MRQTSLPGANADPIDRNPVSSQGFSTQSRLRAPAKKTAVVQARRVNFYSNSFIAETVSKIALGANSRRAYLAIQNNSVGDIYVAFGTTATLLNSFKMISGAVWTFEAGIVPDNTVHVITTTPGSALQIVEGSYQE